MQRRRQRALAVAVIVNLGVGVFGVMKVGGAESVATPTNRDPSYTVTCEHGVCTFTAGLHPETASQTRYEWDWDDGTWSEGRERTHTFQGNDDSYTVTLKSIDAFTGDTIRKEKITCVREEYTLVVTSCE